jgi:hypothetical protein
MGTSFADAGRPTCLRADEVQGFGDLPSAIQNDVTGRSRDL